MKVSLSLFRLVSVFLAFLGASSHFIPFPILAFSLLAMPGRLQDRVALITGASSGIGRATAFAFAEEGAKVVCADLKEESWRTSSGSTASKEHDDTTHGQIKAKGGHAVFVKCDTTDSSSVLNAVETAVREFGRLDIMVNNAGVALEGANGLENAPPVWAMDDDLFLKEQTINVHGVFFGVKHAAAQMLKQEPRATSSPNPQGGTKKQRGVILNAASIFGQVAMAQAAAYCTSKGAVANLTRAAALDCAPQGIRVNAVCPGFIGSHLTDAVFANPDITAMINSAHPFGGIGNPEDVARAYVFLASDDAAWVSGVSFNIKCILVDCSDQRTNFCWATFSESSHRRWRIYVPVTTSIWHGKSVD